MKSKIVWPTALFALLLNAASPVNAQVDSGYKVFLYEDGVLVGEVFVEPGASLEEYTEHWVLNAKYKYLGPRYLRALTIKADPTQLPYRDVYDFFARVTFRPGYKYVRIGVTEAPAMPPISNPQ